MESKSYLIGYDLEFQKFSGSIATSIVFSNINRLINWNLEKGINIPKHKRFVNLEKQGVCITYGEMAKFLCMSKGTVTECMRILKSNNIVGMDYVILEMIRCPFLYIQENGKSFCNPQQKNSRFFYSHIAQKTQCFTDAVLHGHIAYWNQQGKDPLVQSMAEISKATGLTYRQVQFSIKKLSELDLIVADTFVDSRYSLKALEIGAIEKPEGVRQTVGGCQTKRSVGSDKTEGVVGLSVDILRDQEDQYRSKGEEEKTPPDFLQKISDHEKKEGPEKTYKNGWFEILESTYHDLQKTYKANDVAYVINRFNKEWDERNGPSKRTNLQEFRLLMGFCLQNRGDRVEKEEREEAQKEQAKALTQQEIEAIAFSAAEDRRKRREWQDKAIQQRTQEHAQDKQEFKVSSGKRDLSADRERKGNLWDMLDEEERGGITREAWISNF